MNTTTMSAPFAARTVKIKAMKRVVSKSQRFSEIMIATLFLATAAVSIPAAFLIDPLLNAPDYLAEAAPNMGAIASSALLWSINNVGIVFIAVFMLPLLRRLDDFAGAGYLASRIIEGTVMMVGSAATLLLIPLSQAYLAAGAPDASWFQTIGDILKHLKVLGHTELSLPLLGLGGMIFTTQLFRFRLVPNVIAITGIVGYALMFVCGIASWFDLLDASPGTPVSFLAAPVAIFEIILLPFWLFFRGFKMPEAATN
jgi:hypothetical protein